MAGIHMENRTQMEKGNVDAVLDGDLDDLIEAYLMQEGGEGMTGRKE